jgi:hypothetical protein
MIQTIEGYYKEIISIIPGLKSADYTTLWRRIRATEFELEQFAVTESESEDESEGVTAAIDAPGMKVTDRGEWMREKWKKRRGWIKVHIIDVNTKDYEAY